VIKDGSDTCVSGRALPLCGPDHSVDHGKEKQRVEAVVCLILVLVPAVEAHRTHFGDVDAEVAMDPRTLETDEDAKIDRGPARTCQDNRVA